MVRWYGVRSTFLNTAEGAFYVDQPFTSKSSDAKKERAVVRHNDKKNLAVQSDDFKIPINRYREDDVAYLHTQLGIANLQMR